MLQAICIFAQLVTSFQMQIGLDVLHCMDRNGVIDLHVYLNLWNVND